jgi:hypothetical protein
MVDVCREILAGEPIRDIVLSVTHGGGKSFVPIIIADNLIPVIAKKFAGWFHGTALNIKARKNSATRVGRATSASAPPIMARDQFSYSPVVRVNKSCPVIWAKELLYGTTDKQQARED